MDVRESRFVKERDRERFEDITESFRESGYRVVLVGSASKCRDYNDIDLLFERNPAVCDHAPFDKVVSEILNRHEGRVLLYGRDRALDYAGTVIAHRCKLWFRGGTVFDLCHACSPQQLGASLLLDS